MKTREEWARELAELGVSACRFWNLDEKGKEKFIEFLRHLKAEDDAEIEVWATGKNALLDTEYYVNVEKP